MGASSAARRRPDLSRGDAREAALLEVAEALLREGRFEETSIGEIAVAADISRSGFYFYFASKRALLERLIETRLGELTEQRLAGLRRREDPPAERLSAFLHGVAQMWVEHTVVLRAAAELGGGSAEVFDHIAGVVGSGVDAVAAIVVEAGTTPETTDVAAARSLVTTLLWMGERNFYVLARRDPDPQEFHDLAELLLRIWVRAAGIDPDGGGERVDAG